MVDGAAYLGSFLLTSRKIGLWTGKIIAIMIILLVVFSQERGEKICWTLEHLSMTRTHVLIMRANSLLL